MGEKSKLTTKLIIPIKTAFIKFIKPSPLVMYGNRATLFVPFAAIAGRLNVRHIASANDNLVIFLLRLSLFSHFVMKLPK